MNALGDRCHSVLVLMSAAHLPAPALDSACGYHVGCVLASATASDTPTSEDITQHVVSFCNTNKVACAVETVADETVGPLLSTTPAAIEHLTAPFTLMDATRVTEASSLNSLLTWLYGTYPTRSSSTDPSPSSSAASEAPYSLVAVLDVSRGAFCTPSSDCHAKRTGDGTADAYAWLRPTPSYYSELMEAAKNQADASAAVASVSSPVASVELICRVFPVQVYSHYPVVRDRGLQERHTSGDAVSTLPVEHWTNKSTLDALLRELAFKAGQLAKYGA